MKWLRPKRRLEPCPRRDDCISPKGHYGPCQIVMHSPRRLVFVNEDGTLWEEPLSKPIELKKPKPRKRRDLWDELP